jgi:hypothetical protein
VFETKSGPDDRSNGRGARDLSDQRGGAALGLRDDLLDMVGLDCGAAAERIARHRVGQEEAVYEHPNRTGDYNRACRTSSRLPKANTVSYYRQAESGSAILYVL